MSTPRICIVSPEFIGPFPNGGVGTACYWEAAALGRAGHDVTVLYTGTTQRETPEYWAHHYATSAPFRYVDLSRATTAADATWLAQYDLCCPEERTAELTLAWLQRQAFDLVLFQEFQANGARALQARRTGLALTQTRMATTMHSCRQWVYEGMHRLPGGPQDLTIDALEKESARLADRVIAPSRHMAEWASSRWGLEATSAVIPYCFDPSLAQPAEPVTHAGPFRHLVFFGRLETRKGLHLFCRALVNDSGLRQYVDRVTFLGKPSTVEGRPSGEFIAEQMALVPGLDWQVISNLGSLEAQAWLAAQPHTLVVAPSLVDNLPYAVIELHTRRIPYVSTRIGGIPEIVGDANQHLLALPSEASLAQVIGRICRDGHVTIDYRSGYDVAAANDAHVAFVRTLLARPTPSPRANAWHNFDVVVTNAGDTSALASASQRLSAADDLLAKGRWARFEEWQPAGVPALFVDARVTPSAGCAQRLLTAVADGGTDLATSYYVRQDDDAAVRVMTPLGGALETAWRQNTLGGPCFAAAPRALPVLRASSPLGAFAFWPAYVAAACRGLSIGVLPAALYTVPAAALRASGHAEIEAVVQQFHTQRPEHLDLGWTLKSVMTPDGYESPGRGLYERLVSTPDDLLAMLAGMTPDAGVDPYVRQIDRVRARLAEVVGRWRETEPRVFVYGTGQHTRMLLTLCPDLGPFIGGFIDRQAMPRFLGQPCVTPEAFHSDMADAVLYSSREWEHEMYAGLKDVPVEHVLVYGESPEAPEASTAVRLRQRFGHTAPDLSVLKAMYQPPSWVTGYVSGSDAAFLFEMIAAMAPRTVVEVGVASGVSSAVLLCALDQLPEPESRRLHSVDLLATCYFNESYATGQACREMYPRPRARWQTAFDADARALAATLASGSVDLTFIDANHAHPFPLIDLLQATAFAKPGSWVILHDVDLPIQHPEYQVYGPRWLYQAWPFNKVKSFDRWASIAAVQLPEDPAQLAPMALSLLERPWEQALARAVTLPPAFASAQAFIEARLSRATPALVA